jgi:hypothetical protein
VSGDLPVKHRTEGHPETTRHSETAAGLKRAPRHKAKFSRFDSRRGSLPIFADIAPQCSGVTTVSFGSFGGLATNRLVLLR